MCYPGSGDLSAVQKLFHLVDQQIATDSLTIAKNLCADLNQAGAFVNNHKIAAALNTLTQGDAYLAHEFLIDHWQPLYSVDVHQQIHAQAGLSYLGSANPCDNLDNISIPAKMHAIVQQTKTPVLKEYLKDLVRDAKQRIDIFQKNPCALAQQPHLHSLSEMQFKLLPNAPLQGVSHFQTAIGKIQAPQALLAEMFAQMHKNSCSFQALLTWPDFAQNPMFLIETLFLSMQVGYIHPVLAAECVVDPQEIEQINQRCNALGIPFQMIAECGTAIEPYFYS